MQFTRENGGYRIAKCGGASRKRLLQVGDRTGHAITTALREAWESSAGHDAPEEPAREPRAGRERLARALRRRTRSTRRGRARRRRPLLQGGRGARRALDEPPGRDRRGDADRARPRRRGARPGRAPVPPERRRLAGEHAGLLDPRDDARLRRGAAQRRRRGVHRLARPARRGLAGDRRRGREGERRRDARRPAGGAARHDAHRRGRRRGLAAVHAAALPGGGNRPPDRADLHLPCPPLPERRARHRHRGRDDARRASSPAARSRAGRTGGTG